MTVNRLLKSISLLLCALCVLLFYDPMQSMGQSAQEIARLGEQVGELYRQGRYEEAIPIAKRFVAIAEKVLGPEHPTVAGCLNFLAMLYKALSAYDKAEPLYKRALAIKEKALGPDHPSVATGLNNLALLYHSLGAYDKAEPLYKRALAIKEKALGPEHPAVATGLNNLAELYRNLSAYDKAEPLYKRALAIREKALGPEHLDVAQSLNNLAVLYHSLGAYDKAEPLHKRALAIREKALGPDHPDVAASLNNLALHYDSLGAYDKAEPLYKRALAIAEKALGPEHPDVATSLDNLAVLYHSLGAYDKAEPLHKRALAIDEEAFGPDHPNVATSLNNLAELYRALGAYDKAEPLHKRALAIREKALGPDHPDVAASLNNLAGLYGSLGAYGKAEPLLKRALVICEKVLEEDHPKVATGLNNLAELYRNLGAYDKAEPLHRRALAIREKVLGPEHPDVAQSLNNLALLYGSLGAYDKAEPLLKRTLAICEKGLGPDHPDVATSLNNLAELYKVLGTYDKAALLLKRALAICEKALGPDHPDVATSLNNLAVLYLADGRLDEAFNILKKLDSSMGLGACHLAKGDYKMAAREFQRSLKHSEKLGAKKFLITDHIGLGCSYEGMGDLKTAKVHFKKAIDLIESQWQSLGLAARKTFLAGKVGANFLRIDAYEGMVRVIIKERKTGYQKKALMYAERVKSRTLLEILAARDTKGVGKTDQQVFAKDRTFQQDIAMLKKQLTVLTELGANAPKGEKERIKQALNKTHAEYERFINEVKLEDKELASLVTVEVSPIEKIQSLLDPSTTILEYFTAKDNTYAWLITKNAVKVRELDIGNKALLASVNDLLLPNISNRSRRPEPVIMLSTGGIEVQESSRKEREENRQRFVKTMQKLYEVLLGPVKNSILSDTLIIVPHGALHKVPFSALGDGKQYLVDRYALTIVPSSTVIEYVVDKRNKNQGKLLAFANPETDYIPLGFAEIEVNNISRLFSKPETYVKKEATEKRAKGRSHAADIIHLACHGEFNDKQPMQSGLLLTKDTGNDGYLQVHEIFGLNLQNANLVVLSACETALSKIYGGDDLVGLSRGFIYAGTPSLLATLWKVDDQSTSILMKEFYNNWSNKGMSKPEALRQAQLTVKSMPSYRHPYYWAPFVMMGDWK